MHRTAQPLATRNYLAQNVNSTSLKDPALVLPCNVLALY